MSALLIGGIITLIVLIIVIVVVVVMNRGTKTTDGTVSPDASPYAASDTSSDDASSDDASSDDTSSNASSDDASSNASSDDASSNASSDAASKSKQADEPQPFNISSPPEGLHVEGKINVDAGDSWPKNPCTGRSDKRDHFVITPLCPGKIDNLVNGGGGKCAVKKEDGTGFINYSGCVFAKE